MVGILITMHIDKGVNAKRNTARSRLREDEVGKRGMIPKDPTVLDIENCTKLIDNHLCHVWIIKLEFRSNGWGYTFLGAEEGMESTQTILKQVLVQVSESIEHDLFV
jgi:hypothetical protein